MSDLGLTHVALPVRDLDLSLAFYEKYAGLEMVHLRKDGRTGRQVAWLGDRIRPFVIVLIEAEEVPHPLLPISHLGIGCESREQIDRLAAEAEREGRLHSGPTDSGAPVGYWALITDPDGHTVEVSFGQEVSVAVSRSKIGSRDA